ncbi:hypothetical protein HDU92_003181 [Lobulomyces angularis]|nr:hypothetical protein HDU92_003181 [Lobulomyces angularis]
MSLIVATAASCSQKFVRSCINFKIQANKCLQVLATENFPRCTLGCDENISCNFAQKKFCVEKVTLEDNTNVNEILFKYYQYDTSLRKNNEALDCSNLNLHSSSLSCQKPLEPCTFDEHLLNFTKFNTDFPSVSHTHIATFTNDGPQGTSISNDSNISVSFFIYLIVPFIALAILIPCIAMKIRACYKGRKAKPVITYANPTEIAYQERLVPDPVHNEILNNPDFNTTRMSLLSNNNVRPDSPIGLPMTSTRDSYQIDIQSLNPSGSGSIRIIAPILNSSIENNFLQSASASPGNLSIIGSVSTATVYTSKPPNYDE